MAASLAQPVFRDAQQSRSNSDFLSLGQHIDGNYVAPASTSRLGHDESNDQCRYSRRMYLSRIRYKRDRLPVCRRFGHDGKGSWPAQILSQFDPAVRDPGREALLVNVPYSFEIWLPEISQSEFHGSIVAAQPGLGLICD
jgi:hypothetical protein